MEAQRREGITLLHIPKPNPWAMWQAVCEERRMMAFNFTPHEALRGLVNLLVAEASDDAEWGRAQSAEAALALAEVARAWAEELETENATEN